MTIELLIEQLERELRTMKDLNYIGIVKMQIDSLKALGQDNHLTSI
jgi:hypothetical protein